jgi:hypothetical protein
MGRNSIQSGSVIATPVSGTGRRLSRSRAVYEAKFACSPLPRTQVATAFIRNLPLNYCYAGWTLITDRTLEILGEMPSALLDLRRVQGTPPANAR